MITAPAFGWGCDGHQIIALMARAQLKPQVSAALDKILLGDPISPQLSRFCRDRPPDILADVATWADDVRNQEGNGEWHFVDIPRTVTKPPPGLNLAPWCGNALDVKTLCVTAALQLQLTILKSPASSAAERGRALRYIVHLVEDVHQPLHAADNNDSGGNCTVMTFFSEPRPTNLHSVWDSRLIAHDQADRKQNQSEYATGLAAEFARKQKSWAKDASDPERWAWESHVVALKVAYGGLSPQIAVEQPGGENCDAERAKTEALKITLGDDYFKRSIPAVREQLAKSAARLASLLNRTL
jgi:hypothetical protein